MTSQSARARPPPAESLQSSATEEDEICNKIRRHLFQVTDIGSYTPGIVCTECGHVYYVKSKNCWKVCHVGVPGTRNHGESMVVAELHYKGDNNNGAKNHRATRDRSPKPRPPRELVQSVLMSQELKAWVERGLEAIEGTQEAEIGNSAAIAKNQNLCFEVRSGEVINFAIFISMLNREEECPALLSRVLCLPSNPKLWQMKEYKGWTVEPCHPATLISSNSSSTSVTETTSPPPRANPATSPLMNKFFRHPSGTCSMLEEVGTVSPNGVNRIGEASEPDPSPSSTTRRSLRRRLDDSSRAKPSGDSLASLPPPPGSPAKQPNRAKPKGARSVRAAKNGQTENRVELSQEKADDASRASGSNHFMDEAKKEDQHGENRDIPPSPLFTLQAEASCCIDQELEVSNASARNAPEPSSCMPEQKKEEGAALSVDAAPLSTDVEESELRGNSESLHTESDTGASLPSTPEVKVAESVAQGSHGHSQTQSDIGGPLPSRTPLQGSSEYDAQEMSKESVHEQLPESRQQHTSMNIATASVNVAEQNKTQDRVVTDAVCVDDSRVLSSACKRKETFFQQEQVAPVGNEQKPISALTSKPEARVPLEHQQATTMSEQEHGNLGQAASVVRSELKDRRDSTLLDESGVLPLKLPQAAAEILSNESPDEEEQLDKHKSATTSRLYEFDGKQKREPEKNEHGFIPGEDESGPSPFDAAQLYADKSSNEASEKNDHMEGIDDEHSTTNTSFDSEGKRHNALPTVLPVASLKKTEVSPKGLPSHEQIDNIMNPASTRMCCFEKGQQISSSHSDEKVSFPSKANQDFQALQTQEGETRKDGEDICVHTATDSFHGSAPQAPSKATDERVEEATPPQNLSHAGEQHRNHNSETDTPSVEAGDVSLQVQGCASEEMKGLAQETPVEEAVDSNAQKSEEEDSQDDNAVVSGAKDHTGNKEVMETGEDPGIQKPAAAMISIGNDDGNVKSVSIEEPHPKEAFDVAPNRPMKLPKLPVTFYTEQARTLDETADEMSTHGASSRRSKRLRRDKVDLSSEVEESPNRPPLRRRRKSKVSFAETNQRFPPDEETKEVQPPQKITPRLRRNRPSCFQNKGQPDLTPSLHEEDLGESQRVTRSQRSRATPANDATISHQDSLPRKCMVKIKVEGERRLLGPIEALVTSDGIPRDVHQSTSPAANKYSFRKRKATSYSEEQDLDIILAEEKPHDGGVITIDSDHSDDDDRVLFRTPPFVLHRKNFLKVESLIEYYEEVCYKRHGVCFSIKSGRSIDAIGLVDSLTRELEVLDKKHPMEDEEVDEDFAVEQQLHNKTLRVMQGRRSQEKSVRMKEKEQAEHAANMALQKLYTQKRRTATIEEREWEEIMDRQIQFAEARTMRGKRISGKESCPCSTTSTRRNQDEKVAACRLCFNAPLAFERANEPVPVKEMMPRFWQIDTDDPNFIERDNDGVSTTPQKGEEEVDSSEVKASRLSKRMKFDPRRRRETAKKLAELRRSMKFIEQYNYGLLPKVATGP